MHYAGHLRNSKIAAVQDLIPGGRQIWSVQDQLHCSS